MKLFRKFFKKKSNKKFYKSLVFQSSIAILISFEILAISIIYLSSLNHLDNLKISSLDKINYIRIDQEDQIRQWILREQGITSQISNSPDIKLKIESINNSKGSEAELAKVGDRLKSLFEQVIKDNQKINSILLFDKAGKIIAYADEKVLQKANSPYEKIQGMIKNSNLYITGRNSDFVNSFFYLTIKDGQPIIAFVNPVFDGLGNRFNILINIKTEQLNQLVMNNNLKTETDTYLIGSLNGNSFLAFGELQGIISKDDIPTNPVIENALSKRRGSGFYKNYAEVNVIGSYSWFAPLNIAIISEVNQNKALAVNGQLFLKMILTSTGLVILLTLVFYFLIRQKVKTITKISDIAMSISQDRLEARFPTGYNDEIGALGIALNHMASKFRRFKQQMLEPNGNLLGNEIDQYEELLHSLIEITSEGFVFLDSNNLVVKINSNFAEIISNSIADSLGVSSEEVFPHEISEAVKNIKINSQEIYQVKFSIPYQGDYIAFLSNVFRKVSNDLDQIHPLGKIIIVREQSNTGSLIESNKSSLLEKITGKAKAKERKELSQSLSMPMISLLGFLKLTKKKLEDTIFPKLASTDIKTLKNIQQIEQNLDSMIADSTQLAKSIREAFAQDEGDNEPPINTLPQSTKLYITEVLEGIIVKANDLFTSRSGTLILENDAKSAAIAANREQFEYIINLLLSRVAHQKEFRTALIQAKVLNGEMVIVIGKINSSLTRSQVSSILNRLNNSSHSQGLNTNLSKGMGLSNIQKILDKCGGSIAVEWIDSNRESYKFYILTFLALS